MGAQGSWQIDFLAPQGFCQRVEVDWAQISSRNQGIACLKGSSMVPTQFSAQVGTAASQNRFKTDAAVPGYVGAQALPSLPERQGVALAHDQRPIIGYGF